MLTKTRANLNSGLITLVFLLMMCSALATGGTIYVDAGASGSDTGTSWADAYNYLQDALAAASSGDEIRVAAGTYTPDRGDAVTAGDREATFQLINGVAIYGGHPPATTKPSYAIQSKLAVLLISRKDYVLLDENTYYNHLITASMKYAG